MPIEFTPNPNEGDLYNYLDSTWFWNGVAWDKVDATITAGGANVFTALNRFSAGISASGATFSGNISAPCFKTFTSGVNVDLNLNVQDLVGLEGAKISFYGVDSGDPGATGYGVVFGANGTSAIPFRITDYIDGTNYFQIDANKIITIGDVDGVYGGTNLSINNTTQTIAVTGRLTASGATFSGNISAPNIVNSWNGATGAVTFTNYVTSFNGKTGAVSGASLGANTFTGLNTFNAGIGASGASFTGTVTVPTPTNLTDAANKSYVDSLASGINWHQAVTALSDVQSASTYVAGTVGYDGGTGVGAYIEANANGALTAVDSVNVVVGNRLLMIGRTNTIENGIYTITSVGSVGTKWRITRATDMDGHDAASAIIAGDAVYVTSGTDHGGLAWIETGTGTGTGGIHIIGTDGIVWTQFTGTATFTAGAGLTANGRIIDVNVDNSTVEISSDILRVKDSGITNAKLANSNITVTAGNGLAGGGSVALGSSVTLTNAGVTAAVAGTGISVSGATGSVTITNTGVQSFNGRTGAVQGVSAAVAGTGISISGATGSVTITNTGVQSFNGLTGAVTGVASVNGSTGAVVTYVGTTGNIPYRYGAGVGITANSYFTLQNTDIGMPTDILILSGATTDGIEYSIAYGNQEAMGLEFHRAYAGLGLDESGGAAIVAKGIFNDGGPFNYGSSLWLVTPSIGGGTIRLAPQGYEVVQVSAGNMNINGSLTTSSTATIADTLTVSSGGGGAVLEWDGSLPIPTVLTVYDSGTPANTLTLKGDGTFSQLTTSGTISGATGAFSKLLTLSGGLSASGATFAGDIAVNGVLIGRGAGSVTTNTVLGAGAGAANTTGANNIFVGSAAGDAVTTGARNIAIGSDALGAGVTTDSCVAIGYNALLLNRGNYNIAIGDSALDASTTGFSNLAIGNDALGSLNSGSYNMSLGSSLRAVTTGQNNVAVGQSAAVTITTGVNNIAIGTFALYQANTSSSSNTAIGNQAGGAANASATVQNNNTFIGASSARSITTGSQNVGIGMESIYGITGSSNNTALGYQAGRYTANGTTELTVTANSLYLGYGVRGSTNSVTNETAIGYQAVGLGSNTTVIGNSSTTATTIYGVLNAPGGISLSAGITFTDGTYQTSKTPDFLLFSMGII